jgi:hypothetical protein
MKLPSQSSSKKIFLSHSSKDKALADKLADLLVTGCAVDPNEILVTSLEGKGIPAGSPSFIEFLRAQSQKPKLVILLLSQNYFASHFCLCELGATWVMALPTIPLVVPPLNKSELKATLAVTQAGEIDDRTYLDQLRDIVRKCIDCEVSTATWNVKRDVFLQAIPEIIKLLPAPSEVPRATLEEAQEQYQAAVQEIGAKDGVIRTLKAQIEDLKRCKDADDVRRVSSKYSSADEEFKRLCADTKAEMQGLKWATRIALFWRVRDEVYLPRGDKEWNDVKEADAVREVVVETPTCYPDIDHPKVSRAETALERLKNFLRDPKDDDFFDHFKTENDFPADIASKDFWKQFLVDV